MVNNFDNLIPLLKFDNKCQDYFLIQVMQRNKDGNGVKGSNRNRTIKSYHISSLKQLLEKKEEIIELCDFFHGRVYINLNPKPVMRVLFQILDICKDTLQTMWNGDHPMSIVGMVDSAIAQVKPKRDDSIWVIDIDEEDLENYDDIIDIINRSSSKYTTPILEIINTVHGKHIITKPFDHRELTEKYKKPDGLIKVNSYTLLYANV